MIWDVCHFIEEVTMHRVFKYQFPIDDCVMIEMPLDARIISVQVQRGVPCLWAIVDDEQHERRSRKIYVYGTGHPIDRRLEMLHFLGTIQLYDGGLVFHVFECRDEQPQELVLCP